MAIDYLGYITEKGKRVETQQLGDRDAVIQFLEQHLYAEEVVITDNNDKLVFRAFDGVDLFSGLESLGIDLPAIYSRILDRERSQKHQTEREPWEDLYDSIGLSPGEIQMRQRVKKDCRAARTVYDVAQLLKGTYFEVQFFSEDRLRAWGYFNPEENSVYILAGSEEDGWGESQETTPVTLSPGARVCHISSSEDVHKFILYDPPDK